MLAAYEFSSANPYVCRIPFNTIESAADASRWAERAQSDRYVMRFVAAGAAERDRGLLCIVPIDAWNVALSVPRILSKALSSRRANQKPTSSSVPCCPS